MPLKVKEDYLPITGWYDAPPIPILSNTAECIAGCDASMEKGLFRKLSQGLIRPQAVIDLHGLGEGDALLQLVDFLHSAVTRDIRCALIVHGKGTGYGAARNMGVIKSQIGNWLAIHPKVLAFHTSIPQDGGTGAIYVYLRRYGHTAP
jgi:DNA-nicking Smr family endonuclease